MSGDMGAEHISTHMEEESLEADPDTFIESNLVEIGSNEPPVQDMPVSDIKEEEEPVASTCDNVDIPKEETSVSGPEDISFQSSVLSDSQSKVEASVSGPMPSTLKPEGISSQPCILADSQLKAETSVSGPMSFTFKPVDIYSQPSVLADSQSKVESSVSGPMSFTSEQEGISFQPSVLADSQSKVETSVSGPTSSTFEQEGVSCQPSVLADSQSKAETSVSGTMSFTSEPESNSSQPSLLADSQSLQTRLHPLVPRGYSIDTSLAACRSPRSFQLTGKRKLPPESTLGGSSTSEKPNKRVESVHHRPWLEQFYSASIQPPHMPSTSLSPKTEHPPVPAKRKQVMNKKQTGPSSQGSTKTHNEGNESLRSKMKESLAAALALVLEHEESPKEKKNTETDEASVPLAESNVPGVSGPADEGIKAQQTSNDTEMNYVNQSDVEKTQYDDVFPCDDGPFSGSYFSSDELLQGNGLSWVLEPVSDLEERKENEKSFEDPNLLATKIELELFKLFGGVNKKYKEKGRSLLFNLKDKNNPELRESVMSGKISPERLCSMSAEELASKELSQWRQAKAEEMAEMVVLRDADIDVRSLVRKTHKGEFQVEVDPVESEMVDVSVGTTSRSRPRAKAKSKSTLNKNDSSDQKGSSDQEAMTLPSTEETDPMQGLSMDDEMKDVGFLPPIVSLDEFMESLNTEPPFGSPQHGGGVKEEVAASEKSDSGAVSNMKSPSKSPKQSPKESPKTEVQKAIVTSPKPDVGVKLSVNVSKSEEASLVASNNKEEQIWNGILQLSASSVVSVTGIFKSGEKAKTSEWPTMVEVKGRVRLSAFGKFVQELPLSRSRVLMVINVVCKDGISQSQRDSLFEVAKSYVADQRVGYAEPTSGVELYLCPSRGETLDLLSKVISKDHLDEAKCSDNIGLIGLVVWRRAVSSPVARHKPGVKRQHSSLKNQPPVVTGTKSSVLAPESKKSSNSLNVQSHQPPVVAVTASMGNHGCEDDDEDLPPGFGPAAVKDDDDLPEFNFNTSTAPPVTSSPRPAAPQSRALNQVRELILKYGNSAGNNASKQPWSGQDDDDDDDIPEWQPQVSGHQIQPPPPPPGPPLHSRAMARPQGGHGAGPSDGWRANQNAPRHQQQYSARRNRGF